MFIENSLRRSEMFIALGFLGYPAPLGAECRAEATLRSAGAHIP